MSKDNIISLADIDLDAKRPVTREDFWFLVGDPVPADYTKGGIPERRQSDHFASRLRQLQRLDGVEQLVVNADALKTIYRHTDAMAKAIDAMIRVQESHDREALLNELHNLAMSDQDKLEANAREMATA